MNVRRTKRVALAALLLAAAGCNSSGLVNAGGRLTYKGQPVPSTLITFIPDDGTRPSHGLTDDEGNFKVTYSRTLTGIKKGHHSIALRYDVSLEEELHKIPPKASRELKAVIAKHGDPKTSGLQCDVTTDGQFIELNLD